MYRVFNNFDAFPPPYANPPAGLTPGDYEVSYGTSYYDSTYVPADKDGTGAMMEYYDKRCLPIFPFDNKFSCAFVSLGNKAYFLRYADRPPETPQCCQFSLKNHPPRVDFIKHLPYNAAESRHVGDSLQAYSYRVGVSSTSCSATPSTRRRRRTRSTPRQRRIATRNPSTSRACRPIRRTRRS